MGDIDRPSGPNVEGPDADGFYAKTFDGPGFNGTFGRVLCRPEGENVARVRIGTGPERANPHGALHGGFLLAFLDQAVFVGPITIGRLPPDGAVTLNFATQFVGPGRADIPLDCLVEIVSETGKLLFLRGQMEQEGRPVLSYQATLRKLSPPRG
ncbi:PaaI family thioesterase [Sphingomonas sp. PR090111-T3T-6A]|uniref:PaaI family thioesterase n=1 Tax=Sphingomonas sp. PR090111-T3T-6A TaxID=685778 RepID=UPI00038131E6|nr:PaaI family thioesterase [Sphingomonas sp. PR090111-T3T-6A]